MSALAAIEGIEAAAAHQIALRLGERDAFPASALAGVDAMADRWRPWRALAATHLAWR